MRKITLFPLLLLLLTTFIFLSTCTKSEEPIQIAEMDWQSGGMLAHVVDKVINKGLGYPTKIVPGSTVPTSSSMLAKSKPHIAPELWISSLKEVWDKLIKQKKVYAAAELFIEGPEEGWWIPDYVAKKYPDLKSVEDLKKYAHLFKEPSSGGKGRLYTCPPGWSCEIVNKNLFKALKMADQYELFSPGSGGALDASIARRIKRKQPILTYYWSPTALIGRYNLVRLKMAPFDKEKWDCLSDKDCKDPQYAGWITGRVVVTAVEAIKQKKDIHNFLSNIKISNKVMNKVLVWMEDHSASYQETADYFLKTYPEVWTQWVPTSVANKVKASL